MLVKATSFIIDEKGTEVISERHQKDYQKPDEEVAVEEPKTTQNFTDVDFDDI